MTSTFTLILISLIVAVLFAGIFIWAVKSGQFKNVEEPKYRMLRDDDDKEEKE